MSNAREPKLRVSLCIILKPDVITLTTPLKLGVDVQHSQLATYEMKNRGSKCFGKDVCMLFLTTDRQKLDNSLLNLFSDNVAIYLNVFLRSWNTRFMAIWDAD